MKALVTGGAKRLGRAMALYLADQGYDVAIHYNTSAKDADDVVALIKAKGRHAVALHADILDEAQVCDLIDRASKGLGGALTCLINNASVFEYDTLATATRTSWDRHIESNLRAPIVLAQRFAQQAPKALIDENGEPLAQSLIINMLDQRVRKLTPEFMSYTIAKMGLWAFTQTSARALAPDIRVNAIGPGPTIQGARQTEKHFDDQRKNTILKRGSNPQDICAALGYFLTAPSVTGQLLYTDGGQHLGWETPDILGVE
jgi:NAD(P)-dependent dehydrogenase (short-subunit alcohol dehydrogenase family)